MVIRFLEGIFSKIYRSIYVCFVISLFFFSSQCFSQKFYWEKSNLFPELSDSGFATSSLNVYARDGILVYTAIDGYRRYQWYASSDTLFNFKKITSKGQDVSLNWTGSDGGWITFLEGKILKYNKALDSLVAMCGNGNFYNLRAYVTGNITFHKGRYYMTGAEPNSDPSQPDTTVLLIFDPATCRWTKLAAVTPLYRLFQQGNTLYITTNGLNNEDVVYKSDDEAATWQNVILPEYYFGDSTYYPKSRFNIDRDGNVILRIAELTRNAIDSSGLKTRFYLLQNGMFNLLQMTNAYPDNRRALEGGFRSSGSGNLYYIAPLAPAPQYEAIGDILLKSSDKGNSWEKIDALAPEYLTDVVETSNGRVFGTTTTGIYELKIAKSSDCPNLIHRTKVYPNGKSCNIFDIEVHVSGGYAPYQITINNKTYQTNDSIVISDTLGLYPVKIRDSKNCTLNTSVLASRQHLDSLHVLFSYPSAGQCNSAGFGAMIWKGLPPYTVTWTDGDSIYKRIIPKEMDYIWGGYENFPLNKVADYNFTVKDSLGCKVYSDTIHKKILQTNVTYTPTLLCDSVVAEINILTTITPTNYVTVFIDNDTLLNTEWPGEAIRVKLPYNEYNTIFIRDTNNCNQSYNEYWSRSSATLGYISNLGCDSIGALGRMNINVQNTNSFTTMRWNDIDQDTFLVYRDKLKAGHYSVTVKDKLKCANSTLEFDIKAQPLPKADIPPFLCVGDTFVIKPYLEDPNIKGYFYYGTNRQSILADSLVVKMPDVADTIVNVFFVNQNPQCASDITELIFKRNSSVKPLADSIINYCSADQDIDLVSDYANTIWYSVNQKKILDTSFSIHFNPVASADSLLAYTQSSSGTCHSDTSQISIRSSDFKYHIDTSKVNQAWLLCSGGSKPYHAEITGDRTEIRYAVNDTIFLTDLPAGNYHIKAIDGNGCEGQEYSFTQTVLSILDDKATETPIIIYPNPATNHIQVSGIHSIAAITIYTIEGQKIYEGPCSNQQFINLPDLMPALYFIKVEEESRRNIFKLMIK
ncbi:T9SS type A sorting domain-containing protein [Sporocytophaga myxococcoides]|uniref:T9SS type A sorting domain-containing protein n=1 Tax=Sporocytophaga myxococcoides TaxID=153721 RepID=UPI00138ACEF7|nr:T9SS type A sorting domain-containing protein [Sporocytophaga myxococcoides]